MTDPDERWDANGARVPLDAGDEIDELEGDDLDDVGEGPDEGAESGDGEFDPEAG